MNNRIGTYVHICPFVANKNDKRRSKRQCIHYRPSAKRCVYNCCPCPSTTHCLKYETADGIKFIDSYFDGNIA